MAKKTDIVVTEDGPLDETATPVRAEAYRFTPGPNGETLGLYGIDARDLYPADLARLNDEQWTLLLRETEMYAPMTLPPPEPPQTDEPPADGPPKEE